MAPIRGHFEFQEMIKLGDVEIELDGSDLPFYMWMHEQFKVSHINVNDHIEWVELYEEAVELYGRDAVSSKNGWFAVNGIVFYK